MASDKDFIECKDWSLFHNPRKTVAPYWALALAMLLGVALAGALYFLPWAIGAARAAPKAESFEECQVAADMALVARALAESKEPLVPAARAEAMMGRIYIVGGTRGVELMHAVVTAAYRAVDASPSDFSDQLMKQCVRGRGDMDGILGNEI